MVRVQHARTRYQCRTMEDVAETGSSHNSNLFVIYKRAERSSSGQRPHHAKGKAVRCVIRAARQFLLEEKNRAKNKNQVES